MDPGVPMTEIDIRLGDSSLPYAPTMLPDLRAAVLFCVSVAFTLNKVIEVPANRLREAWVRRRMNGRAAFKLDGTQAASIVV
jgi:hypothetical protein